MARYTAAAAAVATSTSTKTLVQLSTAANHECRVVEIGVTFQGTDNLAAPIEVDLLRQTTTPSGTSSITLVAETESDPTSADTSADESFSSEPTAGNVLRRWYIHPQGGLVWTNPDPHALTVKASSKIGLRVVTPGASVNALAYIVFDE